jgi:hypothetical protein
MSHARLALIVGLILAIVRTAGAQDVPAAEYVIIPIRVHVLTSNELAMANCRLSEADVARVAENINAIWHKAGIHFGVESALREPAGQEGRFGITASLHSGQIDPMELRILLPRGSRTFDGLHVYYFHELPMNSMYMGDDVVIAHEVAAVREVPGGGKDHVARVTAHALGNLLGLENVADPRSLMGNGTSGIALNRSQADSARKVARMIPGATTVAGLRKAAQAAETKGDATTARRLRSWLSAIPGAGAEAHRR